MRASTSALQWVSANAAPLFRPSAAKQPARMADVELSMLRKSRRTAFNGRLSSSISSPSITTTTSFSAALLHVWSPSSQLVKKVYGHVIFGKDAQVALLETHRCTNRLDLTFIRILRHFGTHLGTNKPGDRILFTLPHRHVKHSALLAQA